ncbi:hypothetical protein ACHAWF_004216 [Thalassiosira exigua]
MRDTRTMIPLFKLVPVISACFSCAAFQLSPASYRIASCRRTRSLLTLSSSGDYEEGSSLEGELEETVLRINFSYPSPGSDDGKGRLALSSVQKYTQSFPFAAVLPVQPLTYLPVKMSDGNSAVKVSFLRKKTAEKGTLDGGILFSSSLASEENCCEDGLDNYKKYIQLNAYRITKGQTVPKTFSEKQIVMAFVQGLNDARGKDILMEGGNVEIDSVFHLWM